MAKKPWIPAVRFGDRLRLTRLEYARRAGTRMGTKEMAEMLGVPASTYGGWEGGSPVRNPHAIAMLVARRTGVDEDWLLGAEPNSEPQLGNVAPPARNPVRATGASGTTTSVRGTPVAGRVARPGRENLEAQPEDPFMDLD